MRDWDLADFLIRGLLLVIVAGFVLLIYSVVTHESNKTIMEQVRPDLQCFDSSSDSSPIGCIDGQKRVLLCFVARSERRATCIGGL